MTTGPGLRVPLAVLACAGLAVSGSTAAEKKIAPYPVSLDVRWGAGAGSDAFRDDLQLALGAALATRCFSDVAIAGRDDDAEASALEFHVVLSGAVDETRFDDSIAVTLQPGEPAKDLRRVTRFEVTVDASLVARATGALVNRKHLVAHVTRRPVYVGEDPQAMARSEAIGNIVHDLTRSLGCGGAKLERKIREAVNGAAASSAPR
jgi:hypothetical protein